MNYVGIPRHEAPYFRYHEICADDKDQPAFGTSTSQISGTLYDIPKLKYRLVSIKGDKNG